MAVKIAKAVGCCLIGAALGALFGAYVGRWGTTIFFGVWGAAVGLAAYLDMNS